MVRRGQVGKLPGRGKGSKKLHMGGIAPQYSQPLYPSLALKIQLNSNGLIQICHLFISFERHIRSKMSVKSPTAQSLISFWDSLQYATCSITNGTRKKRMILSPDRRLIIRYAPSAQAQNTVWTWTYLGCVRYLFYYVRQKLSNQNMC